MFIRIYLLSFILHFTTGNVNRNLKITSGLEPILPNSVAMGFFIQLNNTGADCLVECTPDRCCLNIDGKRDCNVLQIIGGCYENIPAGTSRTVRLAAPLLNPFERRGFCVVYVDSKPEGRGVLRDTVKITFDTALNNEKIKQSEIKPCDNIDEDPLNDCKPVNCETYYNGQKPYFDKKLKRCVEAPPCLTNDDDIDDLPAVIYDADTNRCRKDINISNNDLEFVKTLASGVREAKDIIIIKNTPHHDDNAEQRDPNIKNASIVQNLHSGNVTTEKNVEGLKFNCIKKYLIANKNTLITLVVIVCLQCCLICFMSYCLARSCQCEKDKTLVSRFFNYRQDVSVTTPLIDTSNIDTETTFQYFSESSNNIDKKIKCYKACHKEKPHNAKFSMSDDILSKCLTRRDWTRKPKSDAVPELKAENWGQIKEEDNQDKVKKNEPKVNFENEVIKNESETKPKVIRGIMVKKKEDNLDVHPSSEQEVQCHNYDEKDRSSNCRDTDKGAVSLSTEKGAQACFSNDSIDDFLSERGMIFLAGENISKYTFSGDSVPYERSCSELSGKTSKNNIVRTVLSMLHRQAHLGPSSDPGGSKCNDKLDLELLHMSQASVYSSTNESEYTNGFKRTMDSRTSL